MRNLYRLIPSLQCQESPRSKLSGICPVRTVSQGHPPTHTLDRNYLLSRGYGVRVAAKSSERRTSPQSPLSKGLTTAIAELSCDFGSVRAFRFHLRGDLCISL